MIILSDFSQTIVSSVAAQAKDLKEGDPKNMIKHIALNQLLFLRKKFGGRLIICCDADNYWRKKEFKYYKGHRQHKKDDSFLDWDLVGETVTEMKKELAEHFPYTVMEVDGAEADDIIAVLVRYFNGNELLNTGLIEKPSPIVIGSTDGDFQQLQKYKNVKQWNNVQKKFLVCESPKEYLLNHILVGDDGDNIPNICTGDEWSKARAEAVPTRATSFMHKARFESFTKNGIDACLNETEKRNFKRNEGLVDLDLIPSDLCDKIVNTYKNYEIKGSKSKVFKYLGAHRMKLLLSSYQDF